MSSPITNARARAAIHTRYGNQEAADEARRDLATEMLIERIRQDGPRLHPHQVTRVISELQRCTA